MGHKVSIMYFCSIMTNRSPITVILLSLLTLGIYAIIWIVQTKREMVKLGAEIPTSWLLIVPIANLIYIYKYCMGVEFVTKGEKQGMMLFIIWMLGLAPVSMYIAQEGFNKVGNYQN